MKKFNIKDYEKDLSRFDLWNMVYERDDTIRMLLTRVISACKKNDCIAISKMLESLIHERIEREELGMRLVEAMQGLIKENQELKGLTEHFTISTPKR